MLDNGESQTGAAVFFRAALIDAVEAFKDAFAVSLRDADAVIRDAENRGLIGAGDLHVDLTAVIVVFDCVVAEIIEHFLHNDRYAVHRGATALQRDCDMLGLSGRLKLCADALCDFVEIHRNDLRLEAFVIEA